MVPSPIDSDEHFRRMLLRQGYHLTASRTAASDPEVIKWKAVFADGILDDSQATFYSAFEDKSFRKILHAILGRRRTWEELIRICGNEEKLHSILAYLTSGGIALEQDAGWAKGPQCASIDNIGHTFEWFVAEWIRNELGMPARHGVALKEVPRGGDLDVVAFNNDIRVLIECKTSAPDDISEQELRWFLQRVHDFDPEIAILLFDTDSLVAEPANRLLQIRKALDPKPSEQTGSEQPAPETSRLVHRLDGYKELYWCTRNIFVTNTNHGIDSALTQAFRWYHSFVRHQLFARAEGIWDFVNGTVERKPHGEPPIMVEGQLWFQLY